MKKLMKTYVIAMAILAISSLYLATATPAAQQRIAPPAPEVNFGGAPPPCGPWPYPPCPPNQAKVPAGKQAPAEPAGK